MAGSTETLLVVFKCTNIATHLRFSSELLAALKMLRQCW